MKKQRHLLTEIEAAHYLGVSPRTVRLWAAKGHIKKTVVRKTDIKHVEVRYSRDELDKHICYACGQVKREWGR